MNEGARFTVESLKEKLPTPDGKRFFVALERGELTVELYQPRIRDLQGPQTRDECYVVAEGRGEFVMGDRRVPFGPGDFLFVPAGMTHRFENFGETMAAWVVFYGPEGGDPKAGGGKS